jgi:predicted  nucleic acid-binding Zn-ribbon protein
MLQKTVQEKEAKLEEVLRVKEGLKKKYLSMKKKTQEHIETEGKLAKENDNLIQKLKKIECDSGNELSIVKETKEQLNVKNQELETQLKEFGSVKQNLSDLSAELNDCKKKLSEQQEMIGNLESEKSNLTQELNQEREMALQYQRNLSDLQNEFSSIKSDLSSNSMQNKNELQSTKAKLIELNKEFANLNKIIQDYKDQEDKFIEKLKQNEIDLKEKDEKLAAEKRLCQELEEKNSKLMEAIHQDVNTKQNYKISTQEKPKFAHQSSNNENLDSFSFRETKLKNVVSPPHNLIVESNDDLEDCEIFNMTTPLRKDFSVKTQPEHARCNSNAFMMMGSDKKSQQVLKAKTNNQITMNSASKKQGIHSKIEDFEQKLKETLMNTKTE